MYFYPTYRKDLNQTNVLTPMIDNRQKLKKAIYTCISGNYDTLREPTHITDG